MQQSLSGLRWVSVEQRTRSAHLMWSMTPAFKSRPSIRPQRFSASSRISSLDLLVVTSPCTIASDVCSLANACNSAGTERERLTTLHAGMVLVPCRRNRTAARPMPRLPPVTRMTFFVGVALMMDGSSRPAYNEASSQRSGASFDMWPMRRRDLAYRQTIGIIHY